MTVEREREKRLAELETGCEEIESPAHRPSAPSRAAEGLIRSPEIPGGSLEGLRCR
jgi:hypothetical protein